MKLGVSRGWITDWRRRGSVWIATLNCGHSRSVSQEPKLGTAIYCAEFHPFRCANCTDLYAIVHGRTVVGDRWWILCYGCQALKLGSRAYLPLTYENVAHR